MFLSWDLLLGIFSLKVTKNFWSWDSCFFWCWILPNWLCLWFRLLFLCCLGVEKWEETRRGFVLVLVKSFLWGLFVVFEGIQHRRQCCVKLFWLFQVLLRERGSSILYIFQNILDQITPVPFSGFWTLHTPFPGLVLFKSFWILIFQHHLRARSIFELVFVISLWVMEQFIFLLFLVPRCEQFLQGGDVGFHGMKRILWIFHFRNFVFLNF